MRDAIFDLAVDHGRGRHDKGVAEAGCLVCEAEDRIPALNYEIKSHHSYSSYAAVAHPYLSDMVQDIHDRLIQSLRNQGATEQQISQVRIETREEHGRTVVTAAVPAMNEAVYRDLGVLA